MSGYTVTISPWGRRGRRPGVATTVEVSTDPATARVIELTVHAAGGLSPDKLPVIDYQTLVAALNPQRAEPAAAPTRAPTPAARRYAASTPAGAVTRAYRRMPDAREVVAVWRKGRKVMVVADHFGVPRHTATGWLRRLRSEGAIT
jgi:hypothetical protein